jgi:hypothetical protein
MNYRKTRHIQNKGKSDMKTRTPIHHHTNHINELGNHMNELRNVN